MKKNLNLNKEQILGRTKNSGVLFTDKRIKVSSDDMSDISIGLDRIDTINTQVKHLKLLLPLSILLAFASVYFVVFDRFIQAGIGIMATGLSYLLYVYSKKKMLEIKFDTHSILEINVANLAVDVNALIGSITEARFQHNHDQYRSKSSDKLNTAPIKISA